MKIIIMNKNKISKLEVKKINEFFNLIFSKARLIKLNELYDKFIKQSLENKMQKNLIRAGPDSTRVHLINGKDID